MSLSHLPDHSRVWIFSANRALLPNESINLSNKLDAFVQEWQAHGKDLSAGFEIYFDCILVLAVDELAEVPSGCSIDKAFRLLQEFCANTDINFFNRTGIYRLRNNLLDIFNGNALQSEIKNKSLLPQDQVIDTMITELGNWRKQNLVPAGESWAARYFNS